MLENSTMHTISKAEIAQIYRKRSMRYDFTANLYYLIGLREFEYRQRAVEALDLQPDDTVVEIGCGTGLNFGLLEDKVGTTGRIIGVDLTDAMLERARRRVQNNGWTNVDLVLSDAATFQFPDQVGGVLSTFALTLVPEYDRVIYNGSRALRAGKHWVVLDFKMTSNWLAHIAPVMAFFTRPFAVRMEMAERHPWESIERHLHNVKMTEFYGGFAYIATGERAGSVY